MIWFFVVGFVAFVVGALVGAWAHRWRTQQAARNAPVRLPAQSEFLAQSKGPVGPDRPPAGTDSPVPGLDRKRDDPTT